MGWSRVSASKDPMTLSRNYVNCVAVCLLMIARASMSGLSSLISHRTTFFCLQVFIWMEHEPIWRSWLVLQARYSLWQLQRLLWCQSTMSRSGSPVSTRNTTSFATFKWEYGFAEEMVQWTVVLRGRANSYHRAHLGMLLPDSKSLPNRSPLAISAHGV